MNGCPKPRHARRITKWKRLTQAAFALAFLVLPLGGARGFTWVAGTLASLQIGPVDLVEPAGAVAAVLAGARVTTALATGALLLLALAAVLGPVFCSWVCPWGLISETIDSVRGRPAARWTGTNPRAVRRARWATLAGLLAASFVLATPIASLVSGPRLITTLPLEAIHLRHVSWVTGSLLVALLALELAGPRRLWCRIACPAGAAARLARTPRTLGPVYEASRCADPQVPLCLVRCPWGLDPRRLRWTDGCTTCMACLDACGTAALAAGFGRKAS